MGVDARLGTGSLSLQDDLASYAVTDSFAGFSLLPRIYLPLGEMNGHNFFTIYMNPVLANSADKSTINGLFRDQALTPLAGNAVSQTWAAGFETGMKFFADDIAVGLNFGYVFRPDIGVLVVNENDLSQLIIKHRLISNFRADLNIGITF